MPCLLSAQFFISSTLENQIHIQFSHFTIPWYFEVLHRLHTIQLIISEQKTITYPKDRSLSEYVKYHGETRNGEPNGNGTMEYKNGDTYVGEWEYGKRNGTGTLNFNKKDER